MEKKASVFLSAIVVGLIVILSIYILTIEDKVGPVITIDDSLDITYTEGQGDDVLFQGVTAVDKRDGNVSSSLIVESKFIEGDTMRVYFAAKDKHNNITISKKYRTVKYVGNVNASNSNNVSEENNSQQDEVTNQDSVSTDNAYEVPRITLLQAEASINVGTEFNPLDYVLNTYDNRDQVMGNIRIEGEYDQNTVGDYRIVYTVFDSEGNVSEPAELMLHVIQ